MINPEMGSQELEVVEKSEKESPEKKYEVSPELVEKIENSKLFEIDKVNFLLTCAGLKPASEIEIMIKTKKKRSLNLLMKESDIREIVSIFEKSGLPFRVENRTDPFQYGEPDRMENGTIEYIHILIGNTKEKLKQLERAFDDQKESMIDKEFDSKYHKELGLALGFLPTAVEVYLDEEKQLNIATLPKDIRDGDALLFSSHILSKDNWQKEIEQGQVYAEFVKSVSPKIYEEYIAFKREDEDYLETIKT